MRVISIRADEKTVYVCANGVWTGLSISIEAVKDLNSMFALDLKEELKLVCQENGLTDEESAVAINLMTEWD